MTTLAPAPVEAPTDTPTPLTHCVCVVCWSDVMHPDAIALCGELANGRGTVRHVCGWQGAGCGCTPCPLCVLAEAEPCWA